MPTNTLYDVIIVGSGPAGISTALHLLEIAPQIARHTLILEKARHPRQKLCAGGILPDGEAILRRLGLDITEVPHVDVDWAHFDFRGRGMRMRAERGGAFAFRTIRRNEFDAWLVKQARKRGLSILEETAVKQVAVTQDEVILETERGRLRARVVVGADGSNSLVRRAVCQDERLHVARTLEIITPAKPKHSPHRQRDSYFDFFCIPNGIPGYVWDFPILLEGKPMRCWGVYDSNLAPNARRPPLRAALAEELARHGYRLEDYEIRSHPIRWFDVRNPIAAARLVLVGDAAGCDVLYGEGISPALGYGEIAARAILDAFANGDFSFRNYRTRLLDSKLGKTLRWRAWFARLFYWLHSAAVQRFLWHYAGRVIRWIIWILIIGWAKRRERG